MKRTNFPRSTIGNRQIGARYTSGRLGAGNVLNNGNFKGEYFSRDTLRIQKTNNSGENRAEVFGALIRLRRTEKINLSNTIVKLKMFDRAFKLLKNKIIL